MELPIEWVVDVNPHLTADGTAVIDISVNDAEGEEISVASINLKLTNGKIELLGFNAS